MYTKYHHLERVITNFYTQKSYASSIWRKKYRYFWTIGANYLIPGPNNKYPPPLSTWVLSHWYFWNKYFTREQTACQLTCPKDLKDTNSVDPDYDLHWVNNLGWYRNYSSCSTLHFPSKWTMTKCCQIQYVFKEHL